MGKIIVTLTEDAFQALVKSVVLFFQSSVESGFSLMPSFVVSVFQGLLSSLRSDRRRSPFFWRSKLLQKIRKQVY